MGKKQVITENNLETAVKKERELLTIYIDLELVNFIDDFIHNTKKLLPVHKKKKLNRTVLFHLVLDTVMQDYSRSNENSFLRKLISEWKTT